MGGFSLCKARKQFDKLEFGGESPRTMRAGCYAFRYCPDPLGVVTAKQLNKLEFGGQRPQAMRAWCTAFRHCPNPLGIVTAKQLDKLDFICEYTFLSYRVHHHLAPYTRIPIRIFRKNQCGR